MTKVLPLAALTALSLIAACSSNPARNFAANALSSLREAEDPPTAEPLPAPEPTIDTQRIPSPDTTGTLTRTTDGATNIVGGVLHVAGNTVLGLSDRAGVGMGSRLGQSVDAAGHALSNGNVGALPIVGGPVAQVVQTADNTLSSLAQVQVVSLPAIGATTPSGNQLVGVSTLSQTPATGTLATVGVANQSNQPQQPVNVSVGGTQVLGNPGPATVNVNLLNGGASTTSSGPANPVTIVTNVVTGVVAPIVPPILLIPGGR